MHKGVNFQSSQTLHRPHLAPVPTYRLTSPRFSQSTGCPHPNSCLSSHLLPQGYPTPPNTPGDRLTEGPILP